MKLKSLLLLVLPWIFAACSKSGGSATSSSESVKYGNRAPIGNLPDLDTTYRPKYLSSKIFTNQSITYAPMDFQTQTLSLEFDSQAQTVVGRSVILFRSTGTGHPYFQLSAFLQSAKVNGSAVSFEEISDPDGIGNKYLSLSQDLEVNQYFVAELNYTLPAGRVSFSNGGVGFLTDMTDLLPGEFFERWGPANFEEDSFAMTVNLKIVNSTSPHRLYTNGEGIQTSSNEWTANFPSHFTSSSIYLHLTNRALSSQNFSIEGLERTIPVTVYSSDPSLNSRAQSLLPSLFKELEADYGPYPHPRFLAYMHSGGGGMEYSGATITSVGALDHELFHSWFARGVMPAEGRSGWIDEAMASWRDNGYFQASTLLTRTPTVLAAFSPFRKSTPSNCYKDGRSMLSELDVVLSEFGGLKPFMKSFFSRYRYRVITTEEFWNYLEAESGLNLDNYFRRYIFGNATTANFHAPEFSEKTVDLDSKHPKPLTESELQNLR